MIHRFKKVRAPRVVTLTHCSAILGLALALGACSSRPSADPGLTQPAPGRPSPTLAKRLTPAGLAMATLGVFHEKELDQAQALELGALRARMVSEQRAMGSEVLALRDGTARGTTDAGAVDRLGSSMTEKQRELLDHALAGVLELSATLSPAQRAAVVVRAKDDALSARLLAARLTAAGGGGSHDQIALAQGRATIFEELAQPAPDQDRVRTLGSAFVSVHAHANGGPAVVPAASMAKP